MLARSATRPAAPAVAGTGATPRWKRYVALGDSLTEGLCDTSRMPLGEYRGWADRLAQLLAYGNGADSAFRYANLAIRSKRVQHLLADQLPMALRLRPDLVSVFMGANDLVGRRTDPRELAGRLEVGVRALRDAGCDVLLVTPFLPRRRAAVLFARRFAEFNSELRRIAVETGSRLLDLEAHPQIGDLDMWGADRVHLRARGHRFLAYRAAEALGVPDAEALADLDATLHIDDDESAGPGWLCRHALPWVWRRMLGRSAGDGRPAKHEDYVLIKRPGSTSSVPSP
jgi:phosphatidylinositol alpha 1,6-mannosyltransferase